MTYKKTILALSSGYHDSSAALIADGVLVAFGKEERFTRIKHDSSFPRFAIEYCLDKGQVAAADIDIVVYYEEPALKFSRVLVSILSEFPHSAWHFIKAMRSWLTDKIWVQNEICSFFGIRPDQVHFIPHHLSHAAQCFYVSPFEEATIMTLDAVGEWCTSTLAYGRQGTERSIENLDCNIYPHSLGLLYSAFTAFLGFKPNSQECNTMALAAFGRPIYVDDIYKIVSGEDGDIILDKSYFHFLDNNDKLFSKKFTDLFGIPRDHKDSLPFDIYKPSPDGYSSDHQRFADIARSIQDVTEALILRLCQYAYKLKKSDNLCIAGGVALNVSAIGKIYLLGPFKNIYIPPEPGDGGAAIGAAISEHYKDKNANTISIGHIQYLGEEKADPAFDTMLEFISPQDWKAYLLPGVEERGELEIIQTKSESELIAMTVADIRSGRIVAWVQGRSESGPRALGNRSILADPANIETAIRLSKKVKIREAFRPYALSVSEDDAHRLFDYTPGISYPLKWMQIALPVSEQCRDMVRAAIHIDGTARPQVCSPGDNPLYYKLLQAYGGQSGLSALLNTSYNEKGYPIVNTPDEALLSFLRTDIDTLVINNTILRKKV